MKVRTVDLAVKKLVKESHSSSALQFVETIDYHQITYWDVKERKPNTA